MNHFYAQPDPFESVGLGENLFRPTRRATNEKPPVLGRLQTQGVFVSSLGKRLVSLLAEEGWDLKLLFVFACRKNGELLELDNL